MVCKVGVCQKFHLLDRCPRPGREVGDKWLLRLKTAGGGLTLGLQPSLSLFPHRHGTCGQFLNLQGLPLRRAFFGELEFALSLCRGSEAGRN